MNIFGFNIGRSKGVVRSPDEFASHIKNERLSYVSQKFNYDKYKYQHLIAEKNIEKYTFSSLVSACVATLQYAYPEPPKIVVTPDGKEYKDQYLLGLIEQPNEFMSEDDLDLSIITDQSITGNSYLYKWRGTGRVVQELYPFGSVNITPIYGTERMVEYYEFLSPDKEKFRIDVEDIIHIPNLIRNPRKRLEGISPILLALGHIDLDLESLKFLVTYFMNDAKPGTILKPARLKEGEIARVMGEGALTKIVNAFKKSYSGTRRWNPIVLESGDWDLDHLFTDLSGLETKSIDEATETRVCALFRLAPEEVGVRSGMAHSTENNLYAAGIRTTNKTFVPLWKQNGKKFSKGLQGEFRGEYTIRYDTTKVAAIEEQLKKELFSYGTLLKDYQTIQSKGIIQTNAAITAARKLFPRLTEEDLLNLFPEPIKVENEDEVITEQIEKILKRIGVQMNGHVA